MADRALLVGINQYPIQPLRGSVHDVLDLARFLLERCAFAPAAIDLLVDRRATRANILDRLRELVGALRPGDRAVFHFSGHGVRLPALSPSGEPDGLDEALCPVDFSWDDTRAAIRDREIHRLLAAVPDGVSFVWISDSSHSGDISREITDSSRGEFLPRYLTPPVDIAWEIDRLRADTRGAARGLRAVARARGVALVSACEADQTAADAVFGGKPNGALTYHLLRELGAEGGLENDLRELIGRTADALRRDGLAQRPQLDGPEALAERPFLAALPMAPAASQPWYQVFLELDRRVAVDPEFERKIIEANAGAGHDLARALRLDLIPSSAPPGVPPSRGTVVRVSWWGFHIQISRPDLRRCLSAERPIEEISAAIGPASGPAAPFLGAAAAFVAWEGALLRRLDRGRGVYVSMSWLAPGVFVPSTV